MKKFISVALAVALLVVVFLAGKGFAESDVLQGIFGKMRTEIQSNTDTLIAQASQTIEEKVAEVLDNVVTFQTNRANEEIENYVEQKLEQIETSGNVMEMSTSIMNMTSDLIDEEKDRVDSIF